ncbi:ARF GTPase-activating protein Git [Tribolium castaneum]|uniref:ARF GTPase-activating protein GIT2-like Protein n=1 Tax=Tribolium castaneum TaxID=7070 RepID=D6X2I8_TRICA|nr:PREDICTED: ARF GTPase-activating protein GIT2 [Tribolium castaneum]EFA09439.1 ARF GTPase-activating protein GIT2-like Protein [Tribolium castaneum]|eukprot:XP_967293.1 PREDICTED: ARF GTPase-activating protein GIT2 [Tribolium castaneum]
MSRVKSRQNVEICGDCGAPDATWASINKGILLCTQCCSIHRSLGRHISQVKSLQKGSWNPNQLAMVCTLNNNGANSIWEHNLLENNGKLMKKKPNPKDAISVKSEFIKAKHLQCAYTFRDNATYDEGLENELGKQLHASVRTPNLETSFRLLVQGADPNYFHDERGTTPLHIAAKTEQKLQVELLLVYGADPTFPDAHGKTPIDYAKKNVNKDLLNRLIESQYEVTDAFIQYLTHKRPDHQNGIHFILPQGGFESNPNSLTKLQKMKNALFEQLAMDVYDEIDRRETEAIWLSCVDAIDLNVVPFLPVDSTMSKPRNQGRQKLARFSTPELKSLVFDILIDTQRRQLLSETGPNRTHLREYSPVSDDDPLYDSVAPDEDYALPPIQENEKPQTDTVEQLTKQLKASDSTICDLKAEVNQLKAHVESLKCENIELKTRLSQCKVPETNNSINGDEFSSLQPIISNGDVDLRQNRKNQRPSSMYETREGLKTPNWQLLKNQIKQNDQLRNATQSLYGTAQDKQTVFECTELITRSIQQLCKSIQDRDKEDCVDSGEKVKFAVLRLATILPKETEKKSIKPMCDILPHLLAECYSLQTAHKEGDAAKIERHLTKIRELSFYLAKHTKDILTRYSSAQ